jgi:hypothetical protein
MKCRSGPACRQGRRHPEPPGKFICTFSRRALCRRGCSSRWNPALSQTEWLLGKAPATIQLSLGDDLTGKHNHHLCCCRKGSGLLAWPGMTFHRKARFTISPTTLPLTQKTGSSSHPDLRPRNFSSWSSSRCRPWARPPSAFSDVRATH